MYRNFLRGRVLIGKTVVAEGRAGEESAEALSSSFEEFGFDLARLKTGTPPRVHRDSINYSRIEEQPGEEPPPFFSYDAKKMWNENKDELFHVEQSDEMPWFPGKTRLAVI